MNALCAMLINQVLFGPLASVDMETLGACDANQCAVYWVESERCEMVQSLPKPKTSTTPTQVVDSIEDSGVAFGPE